ncbi:MAG: hypothetical protein AUK47_04690 [Deltaproteobacteria bacterium CG2_30_63_29]|nr:MAG: hypothetical protein AUK47_04690 [Deltaproteobacteria bacterium CG2_30_63_29]PIW02174.1 MAG: hypothetical protein COW42_02635 [Deltaproteobacteria bacterium CG17_big_fil_post_rev_8_21_14_2_50_63_7]PJB48167.1 MAG: hypothetical protein CO108_02800 [Deltaproteobacteria bacterium CG_4_9_14_3_um_filter_63_12]
MIRPEFLAILRCPVCCTDATALHVAGLREPSLACDCGAMFPIVDGIPDVMPHRVGEPAKNYRTETLDNVLAGTYDLLMPLMSATAWRCDPLHFVDWANMALGRAQGGFHLSLPISTANILRHSWGPHLDLQVVAVDSSWEMLHRAKRRLRRAKIDALLIRADVERLPFKNGTFASILSVNGLHTFDNRAYGLAELFRVAREGGTLAGSTLIRDQGRFAEWVLDRYEHYGLSPMLRGKHFVCSELAELGGKVSYESYGAVLFFAVEKLAETSAQHPSRLH